MACRVREGCQSLLKPPAYTLIFIAKWMDAQVRGVPVIWVRGGLGRLLEHGTFELDFEGCVEVSWKGSRDLDKG